MSEPNKPHILYITYDGLNDPLGQSQILPYINGLEQKDWAMHIISFEKPANRHRHGPKHHALHYHKKPPVLSTLFDIIHGIRCAGRIIKNNPIEIIHARGYIASTIGLWLKYRQPYLKFIFDLRGLWPEEKCDRGHWKDNGPLYTLMKWVEAKILKHADALVCLTNKAKAYFQRYTSAPIKVIPTCVDTELFKYNANDYPTQPVVLYAGSVDLNYRMTRQSLEMFSCLQYMQQQARMLMLIPDVLDQHSMLETLLTQSACNRQALSIHAAQYKEMPAHLQNASFGLALYQPAFSNLAVCPTKIGEYLACGLPVILSRGIGDLDELISNANIGVLIDEYHPAAYEQALKSMLELLKDPQLKQRCRQTAKDHFNLDHAITSYHQLYCENVTSHAQ